jgi:hypothetical protein
MRAINEISNAIIITSACVDVCKPAWAYDAKYR